MKNDDYKTEFEEHRKEISLDEGHDVGKLPSRAELHRKNRKPKKKSGHTVINIILGVFTLIMVVILVYIISDFYTPGDLTSAKGGENGTLLEMNNKTSDEKNAIADKEAEKKADSEDDEKSAGKLETETVTKVEKKPESKPVVNVNPVPEKKPEVQVEPQPDKKLDVAAKTHTVGSNENLYRISLKYYGNGSGVAKIKNANGLSSDEIRVGQTLVIP